MARADSRHDFRHLEALLAEASKEAERTVSHLRNGRTRTDSRLWILVAVGWTLAALGWTLFLASHFGYLENRILPESPALVQNKAADDVVLTPVSSPAAFFRCDQAQFLKMGDTRRLSSGESSGSASHASHLSESSGSASHASHDSDALFFLFTAIVLSVVILYATTFKLFNGLQHTVTLFIVGIIYSLILEIDGTYTKLGIIGRSHEMWMHIDPHLLLFTMLPALLTADAMTINTSIAFRVAKQCIYLAGPGVLFNAAVTALFLWFYLPYDWSFMLCLTTGSILCATDPVAVVALLKELGASPTLTVQIQGESLLNDGTAIVLYMISYNILKGEEYDFTDVAVFMVKTAMCAWVLGMFVGLIFLEWIRYANRKLEHNSSLIQCTLTLACAYWSFILAEGVLSISGVLSCVAAAIVLAHKMWPAIVNKEFLHTIWHMFEYLGNTVIFFLAGALTGRTMVHIPGADYLHLFVIYIVLVLVRGVLFFASRPILRILSPDNEPVPAANCLVMTWGGLRGAVGLSLAIQVQTDRAEGEINEMDGQRVLFYVSGVAALTLLINATTCPLLVQRLGITQLPRAKKQVLRLLVQRLRHLSNERPHCGIVTKTIACMLDDVDNHMKAHGRHSTSLDAEVGEFDENFFAVNPGYSESNNTDNVLYGESDSDSQTPRQASKRSSASVQPSLAQRVQSAPLATSHVADIPGTPEVPLPLIPRVASEGGKRFSSDGTPKSKGAKDFLEAPSGKDGYLLKPNSSPTLDSDVGTKSEGFVVASRSSLRNSWRGTEGGVRVGRKLFQGMEKKLKLKRKQLQDGVTMATDYKNAKAGVTAIKFLKIADNNFTEITRDLPKISLTLREQEDDILNIVKYMKPNKDMQRVFVEVFLKLVCADYWKQIGSGAVPNQRDGEILLLTITLALSKGEAELWDFRFLRDWIQSGSLIPKSFNKSTTVDMQHFAPDSVQRFYRSYIFNIFIILNIVLSAAAVWVEEALLDEGDEVVHKKSFWTAMEVWFLAIFIVEFIFKIWDLHCLYFKDVLNTFDFTLIIVGIFGLVVTQLQDSGGGEQAQDVSQQGRLVRGARLFRALRLMRILRIFRLMESVKARIKTRSEVHSKDVSCHMQKVMMLRAFVHAHIHAQEAFIHTFCKDEQVETAEIARVLVDSMTAVNLAIAEAVQVEQSVDKRLLTQVRLVRECTDIAEQLEKFVFDAHSGGVITSKEAESIMRPLHDHLENFYRQLRRTQRGVTQRMDDPRSRRSMFKKMGTVLHMRSDDTLDTLGERGSTTAGLIPMSLSVNPLDLFSTSTVQGKVDAQSRGWQILQQAFLNRHDIGPDGMVWTRMMRGGTRLSRRKSEFRARQRRISELVTSRADFRNGNTPFQETGSNQAFDGRLNRRPRTSTSTDSIQSVQRRIAEEPEESPSLSPSGSFPSQGKNPKSSLRPITLKPGILKSPSGVSILSSKSHEVDSLSGGDEDSEMMSRTPSEKDVSTKRQVGFINSSSTEALLLPEDVAPGMLPNVLEFVSEKSSHTEAESRLIK